MMSGIAEALFAAGSTPAGSLVAKATVIVALALGAARLARRSRASVRHLTLAAAFAVLLFLPAASVLVPSIRVELPIGPETAAAASLSQAVLDVPAPAPADAGTPAEPSIAAPARRVPASALLLAGWAAGAVLFLLPVLVGLWQPRSLRRSGRPWRKAGEAVRQRARDVGLRRRIDVLLHDAMPGPVTCGLMRPVIVLPADAATWTEDERRRAIVHEVEHVRRGDWATQAVARAVCALYWFHPLVWIAWRRLVLEAERACDDAVLCGAESADYADQLVVLAERLSSASHRPLLAMAGGHDLATRVRAVLDSAQARGRAGAGWVVITVAGAVVVVTTMAPLQAVAVPQATAPAGAQEPGPSFEVASIRRNTSGGLEQFILQQPGGRLAVRNTPLRSLIRFAYMIHSIFLIEGGPDWIDSHRFDIVARAEGDPAPVARGAGSNPLRPMLRTLLVERFGLVTHEETRDLPIFELVRARRDGPPGSQLRPAAIDCAAVMAARRAAASGVPDGPIGGPDAPVTCAVRMRPGRLEWEGMPVSQLADVLAGLVQRHVIDRTGLAGNWDLALTYTPDPAQLPGGPPPTGAQLPTVDPDDPSLFVALEEQLGLKLQATRGPVEVLVIDSVEMPTEN